ncbi:MAG TPA: HAD family hydrolase [Steroidobacteraceae bacterium]|nr:HAD family hydrolase [Steroidobacteraceae bacterium]
MKGLIFDLDGTLIDSVYPHALAWQQTLNEAGLHVPAWEVQRHIGISGKLLVRTLARARDRSFEEAMIERLEARHDALYRGYGALQLPLPGATELLQFLKQHNVTHGIATSGRRSEVQGSLQALGIDDDAVVICGDTGSAKPEPDLFLACQQRLGVPRPDCLIVGDSVWDVHSGRRAGILAVGVLTGGFSEQELYNAGAMRVYREAAQLLAGIDELGLEFD